MAVFLSEKGASDVSPRLFAKPPPWGSLRDDIRMNWLLILKLISFISIHHDCMFIVSALAFLF